MGASGRCRDFVKRLVITVTTSPTEPTRTRWVAPVALAASIFLIYQVTFSSVPTSDGYWIISNIDQPDWEWMLVANYPLTTYLFFSVKRALSAVGLVPRTLTVIQTVNALVAGTAAALLYQLIRLLGGSAVLGLAGGALLAGSFACWYFANGETHHIAFGLLLAIFFLVLEKRVTKRPYGDTFVVVMALLNSFAVLLRQDSFLFGFTPVALLVVGRARREALRHAILYTVVGSLGTLVLVVTVGRFLLGLQTLEEFGRWYLWRVGYLGTPQEYVLGSVPNIVLQVVKGQLTALLFGAQVLADTVRRPALLAQSWAAALLALTILACVLAGALLLALWQTRHTLRRRYLLPLVGVLVWLLSYKLLWNWWFWPTSTEYYLSTLPALVLLLVLGPLAASVAPRARGARRWTAGVVALAALVIAVNFWGAILPWSRYGAMKEGLLAQRQTSFGPHDLFISSESGIDSIFKSGNHLAVKGVFKRMPKEEAFAFLRVSIAAEIDRGRRVLIYNFVPSPFTLIGMNQHAGAGRLTARDFERFLADLGTTYTLRPVAYYWEEGREPLYLFGVHLDPILEVSRPASQ